MLHALQTFQKEQGVDLSTGKSLLAVSGGLDSMVMANLFLQEGLKFGIAHVNFGLRGQESDADEQLVVQFATKHQIPIHIFRPDTLLYAAENHLSTQMAARDLRYGFFNETMVENNYNWLVTAHHLNDAFENFFIYLLRNNIEVAFKGIALINGHVIRPLLRFSKSQIEQYARQNKWTWREDKSNEKTDYLRNKVRHWVVNDLMEIHPELATEFFDLSGDFRVHISNKMAQDDAVWNGYLQIGNRDEVKLSNTILQNTAHKSVFKRKLLRMGFPAAVVQSILGANQNGKEFYGSSFKLVTENGGFRILEKLDSINEQIIIEENALPFIGNYGDFSLEITRESSPEYSDKDSWFFDMKNIIFPLTIRSFQLGDKMTVFGMDGHKKISDILIDAKISIADKFNIPLVCSDTAILGVVAIRRSAEAILNAHSKDLIKIKWRRNYT